MLVILSSRLRYSNKKDEKLTREVLPGLLCLSTRSGISALFGLDARPTAEVPRSSSGAVLGVG